MSFRLQKEIAKIQQRDAPSPQTEDLPQMRQHYANLYESLLARSYCKTEHPVYSVMIPSLSYKNQLSRVVSSFFEWKQQTHIFPLKIYEVKIPNYANLILTEILLVIVADFGF